MRHANNFDLFRFLLASLVLFSHSDLLLGQPEFLSWLTHGQIEGGEFAVNFFFVLSGALITGSWLGSRSLQDYLKKRVLRIYPGYLVAVAFCILLIGPLCAGFAGSYFQQLRPLGALATALLLSGVVAPKVFAGQPSEYMNASLWTIPYEFSCYLLVALLGLAGLLRQRRGPWVAGVIFVGLYAAYAGGGCHSGPPAWSFSNGLAWNRLLMYFMAGSVVAYLPKSVFGRRWILLGLTLVLLLASQLGGLRALLPWAGTYVFFAIGFWPGPLPKPPIDISYGIYLYAYPIQQLLIHFGVASPLVLSALSFPLTLGLAALSWYGVELPAIRRMRASAVARQAQSG